MTDPTSLILYAVIGAALLGVVMGVFIDKWLTALLATIPLIIVPMGLIVALRRFLVENPSVPEGLHEPIAELADPSVLIQMVVACTGGVILAGALIRAARAGQGDGGFAAAPRRAGKIKKRVSAVSDRTPLQNRTDRLAAAPRPAPHVEPPPIYEVAPLVGSIQVSSVADKAGDASQENNRRKRGRRRAILAGYLILDEGRSSACRIIDLSETGARVRLPTMMPLPETFWMLNTSDWFAHEVKLAWRSGAEAGLHFLSKRNLRDPVTDRDRALHALCVELAAR